MIAHCLMRIDSKFFIKVIIVINEVSSNID